MPEQVTNWDDMLKVAMRKADDSGPVTKCSRSADEMSHPFTYGWGVLSQGCSFTAWSERRVYFPAVYEGDVWVDSVPRHPCDEHTDHVGGE